MERFSLNFLIYSFSSVWRPIKWSSKSSKLLYSLYTFIEMCLLALFIIFQIMYMIFAADNMDDVATSSLMFLSAVSVYFKAITVITRRDKIIEVITKLEEKPHKACNKKENNIQMKFDHFIRSYTISYLVLVIISATGGTVGNVFVILKGQLPFKAWVPYDITSPLIFWLTALQLILTLVIATPINIATETLLFGLCLQTCAQLEILEHRLRELMKPVQKEGTRKYPLNSGSSKTRLGKHISHHLDIIKYSQLVNEIFSQVLFVQFFVSILVICTTVYYLSSHMIVSELLTLIVYTISMFVQIFIYCWVGNEVICKSKELSEAVYHMDWMLMTIKERKDLLMIMIRSRKPIKFTSSFLVTLSLESYSSILKTAYSAFNLLQQS